MDSLPAIFATSFVVALSGALMPGPMLTLTIAEAARTGWKSGPMVVLGHGVLEFFLLVLVVAGLGGFLASDYSVKALGIIGGATLILMGALTVYGTWGNRATGGPDGAAAGREDAGVDAEPAPYAGGRAGMTAPAGRDAARQAAGGAITSVSNPYWALWWATVGLGYLALAGRMGPAGIGSFFGGHLLADLAWYTLVAFLVGSGRKMIGGLAYRWVLRCCGFFLMFFGGYFIHKGMGI